LVNFTKVTKNKIVTEAGKKINNKKRHPTGEPSQVKQGLYDLCCIRYMFLSNLQFLNHVIIIKTKVLLRQT